MSFERPLVALLALAPWIWFWFESRRTSRRIALACKAASLCAILLALSEPRLAIDETKLHVAVLVDTSASISGAPILWFITRCLRTGTICSLKPRASRMSSMRRGTVSSRCAT